MEEIVFRIEDRNRERMSDDFIAKYVGLQPKWGPLGYVTFKRTYARRLTLAQQRFRYNLGVKYGPNSTEEFWEALRRVTEGAFSVLRQQVRITQQRWVEKEAQHKMETMFRLMWEGKFLPPGRGLGMMGADVIELKGAACANNCGMVGTGNIDQEFSDPFVMLMDYSMLGVGMGFDTKGAGRVRLSMPEVSNEPHTIPDTREGWCEAVRRVLNSFVEKDTLPSSWDTSQIRPEGSVIHTFGGTASGPGPLLELLEGVTALLTERVGLPITSTAITDIMNMIGRCVVAGNVRRSAEIALGDPNDAEFLALKDPSQLIELGMRQNKVANKNLAWRELQDTVDALRKEIGTASVLDETFQAHRERIAEIEAQQAELLKSDPAWVEIDARIKAHPLRKYRWASNNTVLCTPTTKYGELARQTATNGEPGFAWLDTIRQYGRLSDPPNNADAKAIGTNPCGEQSLWDGELCCLVETFPTRHETLEEYLLTLKYAYLYAKIVTLIPTHNAKTNAVIARNRRIGTSMAGIWEMYETHGLEECVRWWREGYAYLRELDDEYSGWMGVARSIKVTSVKPGGTIPLLLGIEGGMKLPISRFYMRTIRIEAGSPLAKSVAAAGYRVEKDLTTPRTVVAYFPCKDENAQRVARDVSLWEQAALFTALQNDWSDNQVSATLTFKPEEARELDKVLAVYASRWKSVSFLPLWDHQYAQAPYIPCSEDEYRSALARVKPLVLDEDVHDREDKFCSGDKCELPV